MIHNRHAEETFECAHVEGQSMNSPLPFHFVSVFSLLSLSLCFLSSMLPCFSQLLLFFFFFPCLPPTPSLHLAFSLALRSPLARSCKWLPANGLSEQKTDLNEERRQKREQRGSKRRYTQRDVCLLETHSLSVSVFFLYVCVQGSLPYSGQQSKTRG